MFIPIVWTILSLLGTTVGESEISEEKPKFRYPLGDIKNCLKDDLFRNTYRYEVLPGMGWDNLQNKDAGQLVVHNYSQCKTTDDGRYLIPDNIVTVPLKSSKLETYAELFEHWSNYTSTTSSSINIDESLELKDYGRINGKFSNEFERVKIHQVLDRSVTTRVQARYVRYNAYLQPDIVLNPVFKSRLISIAVNIQEKKAEMATYESQLLIRDFGTHLVTSVDAGSIIGQMDEIHSSFALNKDITKRTILATASATFFEVANISIQYNKSSSNENIEQYLGNRTHSKILAHGGPIYKPNDFSMNQWAEEMGNDLTAIDRRGDPIYYLISPHLFPELPPTIIYNLTKIVQSAVEEYYKHNTYKGCTNPESPNYSFIANIDDNTCKSPDTNYTFGGIFQTCERIGAIHTNLCSKFGQKNPLTGDYSCPEDYEAVLIDQNSVSHTESWEECHTFLLIFESCTTYYVSGKGIYSSFWCVANSTVPQHSGFQFGGLYTDTIPNLLTDSKSCPIFYHPLKFGNGIHVCVSDDYELGFENSVPFAGFYSCISGNPLAIERKRNQSTNPNMVRLIHSLESYLQSANPSQWPRGCPSGYSSHTAAIEHGCEINYCVKANAFSNERLPPVNLPPFINLPSNAYVDKGITYHFKFNKLDHTWTELPGNENSKGEKTKDNSSSTGVIIAIAACLSVVLVVLTVCVIKSLRKKGGNQDERIRLLE